MIDNDMHNKAVAYIMFLFLPTLDMADKGLSDEAAINFGQIL